MPSWVVHADECPAGATEGDRSLYVLTVADLEISYDEEHGAGAWSRATEEQKARLIHYAERCLEGCFGGDWASALKDAIGFEEGA